MFWYLNNQEPSSMQPEQVFKNQHCRVDNLNIKRISKDQELYHSDTTGDTAES